MKNENIQRNKSKNIFKELGYYTIIFIIYILIIYMTHVLLIKIFQGKSAVYVPTSNARLGIMLILCVVVSVFVRILQGKDKISKQLYPLYIGLFLMLIFIPEGIVMKVLTLKRNWFNILEMIIPIAVGETFLYYDKIKKNNEKT